MKNRGDLTIVILTSVAILATGATHTAKASNSVSNLTSSSASISWTWQNPQDGCVRYGITPPFTDSVNDPVVDLIHCAELTGLSPNTTYLFEVRTGSHIDDNGGAYYSFTTTEFGAGIPYSVYGNVADYEGLIPADRAIVSLNVKKPDESFTYPLSMLADSDGNWLLNLGNLKDPVSNGTYGYTVGDSIYMEVTGVTHGTWDGKSAISGDAPQFCDSIATTDSTRFAWARRYNSGLNGMDEARWMAVDSYGNVYVTGSGFAQYSRHDYVALKYDIAGNKLWEYRYNGALGDGDDLLYAGSVNALGEVFLTGRSEGTSNPTYPRDIVTVKLDSDGQESWVQTLTIPQGNDGGQDIVVDETSGNVYVTGYLVKPGGLWDIDIVTIAYDSDGNELWLDLVDGTAGTQDYGYEIELDPFGDIVVAGRSNGTGTGTDILLMKYNESGDTLWTRRFDGTGNFTDWPLDMAVDQTGGIYIAGTSYGSVSNKMDFILLKYDTSGALVWDKRIDSGGNPGSEARAVTVNVDGSVYVVGHFTDESTAMITVKYSSDGTLMWSETFGQLENYSSFARSVAVDSIGSVYVAGESDMFDNGFDLVAVTYDSLGNEVDARTYDGPPSSDDYLLDIAVHSDQSIHLLASSEGLNSGQDILTIKYAGPEPLPPYICGDTDASGAVDIDDVVYLIAYIFGGGPAPDPLESGDADCSGGVDIDDVVYIIAYIFGGGNPPCDTDSNGEPDC